jgi:beta-lactamase regulating signal transducer with metallopeptidase domain
MEMAISLVFQVAFVVAATALAARTIRTARNLDLLWNACLVVLVLLPAADLLLPHLRLLPAAAATRGALVQADGGEVALFWTCVGVWLCGATVLTLRLVREILRLTALFRTAVPIPATLQKSLEDELGPDLFRVGGRPVQLWFSDSLRLPSCCQLLRPSILLSTSIETLTEQEIAGIIRHELEHLHARHPLLLFLQRIAEIVLWAHPAVWFASRRASRAREFRCDQAAVDSRSAAACYLRTILRLTLVEESPSTGLKAALGFGGECALIVERVERLASQDWNAVASREGRWRAASPILFAALAAVVLWIPVAGPASRRSLWSPWPTWSATVLHTVGVPARDYEVDGHRFHPGEFHRSRSR